MSAEGQGQKGGIGPLLKRLSEELQGPSQPNLPLGRTPLPGPDLNPILTRFRHENLRRFRRKGGSFSR